jgi:hypothetical protein
MPEDEQSLEVRYQREEEYALKGLIDSFGSDEVKSKFESFRENRTVQSILALRSQVEKELRDRRPVNSVRSSRRFYRVVWSPLGAAAAIAIAVILIFTISYTVRKYVVPMLSNPGHQGAAVPTVTASPQTTDPTVRKTAGSQATTQHHLRRIYPVHALSSSSVSAPLATATASDTPSPQESVASGAINVCPTCIISGASDDINRTTRTVAGITGAVLQVPVSLIRPVQQTVLSPLLGLTETASPSATPAATTAVIP